MARAETKDEKYLVVDHLIKWFGSDRAVDDVSFSIEKGKFLTLLGPSGCGKTTTLMSIAGLHTIDSGEIRVGDVIYTSREKKIFLAPEKRDIGMVFQSYAIWPHMTVAQNVAYPLEIRKIERVEIDERVDKVLALVGLTEMSDKLATQLSGGQQQRASLARAIVSNPLLLLFDEPLSNLDLKLREQMRVELKRIQNEVGITSIYVTHDQSEALVMSDEIIVMSKGQIEQRDIPLSVYSKPANGYVSQFIGVANLIEGTLLKKNKSGTGVADLNKTIKGLTCDCVLSSELESGDDVLVSIRPENISVSKKNTGGKGIKGKVDLAIFLGNCVDCRISSDGFEWKVLSHPRENLQQGDSVFLHLDPKHTLAVTP